MTAKEKILQRLRDFGGFLAVHELKLGDVSDNAAATRLSELARDGKVIGRTRQGKAYKEWSAVNPGQQDMRFA